jgi:histone H3/H4
MFINVLKSMGIQSYDPKVTTALSEYARRYATSLLTDAQDFAEHARRTVNTMHHPNNHHPNCCLR